MLLVATPFRTTTHTNAAGHCTASEAPPAQSGEARTLFSHGFVERAVAHRLQLPRKPLWTFDHFAPARRPRAGGAQSEWRAFNEVLGPIHHPSGESRRSPHLSLTAASAADRIIADEADTHVLIHAQLAPQLAERRETVCRSRGTMSRNHSPLRRHRARPAGARGFLC